jgi:ankyrin repeat protein
MLRQTILISLQEKASMGGAASREARLLAASHNGNEEAVDALLKEGKVNIDTRDQDGWAPLHRAAFKGHASVVALLLAAKADPKAEDKVLLDSPSGVG